MKIKKLSIGLIVLWFVFLMIATLLSIREEKKNLPSVQTVEAAEGSIDYEFPVLLEARTAEQATGTISVYDHVPASLLKEGRDLQVGRLCSAIQKDDVYELTVTLYKEHRIGETMTGKIKLTSDDIFPQVITRQAIHEGAFGKTCVYSLKRQKGAWGYETVLEEKAVTCFPVKNSDSVILLSETDGPVVIGTTELSNGEKVNLVPFSCGF